MSWTPRTSSSVPSETLRCIFGYPEFVGQQKAVVDHMIVDGGYLAQ